MLERRPAWASGDFWAPELIRRDGRVLAYYAARGRDGRRCVAVASSARLRGPYGDHGPLVCSDVGDIDPLPVSDEHGERWLVWKQDGNSLGLPTPILAAPLAPGGLELAGAPRELFRGDAEWERGLIEGPAMLRRGGLFYLVYSAGRCCGLRCNYATGVARSSSLVGPWEKRPEPLLVDDALFRCPGHVGIAGGPAGGFVLVHHAYVRGDPANRQFLIRRLRFGADGWPVLDPPDDAGLEARPERIDFGGTRLDSAWQWPVGPRPSVRLRSGALRLGRGALARQAGTATFTAQALVTERNRGARPGLAVMASAADAIGIELRGRRAVAWRVDDGRFAQLGDAFTGRSRNVRLRLAVGERVRFAVRGRGGWRRIGGERPPPRWTSGPRVALRVTGPAGARAEFDALRISSR